MIFAHGHETLAVCQADFTKSRNDKNIVLGNDFMVKVYPGSK